MALDELLPVDRVAEGLWQTMNGMDGQGRAAHDAWLALPDDVKNEWRAHAETAIANWKQSNGFA